MATKVKGYSDAQLLAKVSKVDGFKSIPDGYWILGIRSNEDETNIFDDKFYLFSGKKFVAVTSGTTNPGAPILMGGFRSYSSEGAFILKADMWHNDMWEIGKHKGRMDALVQRGIAVGYRDGDLDGKSEEIGPKKSGYYGINFHGNNYDRLSKVINWFIGGWSAGCQVCNDVQEYYKWIDMIKKSGQKKVSYCLLNEF